MGVLIGRTIRYLGIIDPHFPRTSFKGVSYGESIAGYDVRLGKPLGLMAEFIRMRPGQFLLAHTLERFLMPADVMGIVHDKSTLARQGIAVQNTVLEPGWRGYLTLEITNHGDQEIDLWYHQGIAQVVFHRLEQEAEYLYSGKYQNAPDFPQPAILSDVL
jgi:dCTP deaminase